MQMAQQRWAYSSSSIYTCRGHGIGEPGSSIVTHAEVTKKVGLVQVVSDDGRRLKAQRFELELLSL